LIGSAMALLAGALILPSSPVTPFVALDYVVIAAIISITARLSFVGCVVVSILYGVGYQVLVQLLDQPGTATIVLYGLFLLAIAATVQAGPALKSLLRLTHRPAAATSTSGTPS
jgi:hypothetical protein